MESWGPSELYCDQCPTAQPNILRYTSSLCNSRLHPANFLSFTLGPPRTSQGHFTIPLFIVRYRHNVLTQTPSVGGATFRCCRHDTPINPKLCLHTVRTAASTIAESICSEQRSERRKTIRKKQNRFFWQEKRPKTAESAASDATTAAAHIHGQRRNVCIRQLPSLRIKVGSAQRAASVIRQE